MNRVSEGRESRVQDIGLVFDEEDQVYVRMLYLTLTKAKLSVKVMSFADLSVSDVRLLIVDERLFSFCPDVAFLGLPTVVLSSDGTDNMGNITLTRPCRMTELTETVLNLLKKAGGELPDGDENGFVLTFSEDESTVSFHGETQSLTKKEFSLFLYLYKRRGETVSRDEIRKEVFGLDQRTNVSDVYIKYLRDKFMSRFGQVLIDTVRGKGYRLRHDSECQPKFLS